ncbi:MAG: type II secretion system F family protein [Candidatus Aenigmarchaeota archaeon]|nr:type II secretion system F family protein [Candidatus Aenigmarchaeota archaeon]
MKEKHIIIISASVSVILILLAMIFTLDLVTFSNILIVSFMIIVGPMIYLKFAKAKKTMQFEKEFPTMLRAIAESQKAGLNLMDAIKIASKNEYGIIGKELRKMKIQLSWNVPFETVMEKFAMRTGSSLIKRCVTIIVQANKSGGDVKEIMNSLATNIEDNREVQAEKSSVLGQQSMMLYAIFLIFIGISIAIVKSIVPLIEMQGMETSSFGMANFGGNPCKLCITEKTVDCMACTVFNGIGISMGFGDPDSGKTYYNALFFSMVIVQGFFTGLIVGQITSDSMMIGLRHSLIMVSIGLAVFIIAVRLGLI